jgi:hypothetical protein
MRKVTEIPEVRQISSLAGDILHDVQTLLRQEGRLLRLELGEELKKTERYATYAAWRWGAIGASLLFVLFGLVYFLVEVAGLQQWVAFATVAVLTGAVGLTFYLIGKQQKPFKSDEAFTNLKESLQCLTKRNC